MFIKHFDDVGCHSNIYLIFDILLRNGVVHLVYCDMKRKGIPKVL